NADDCDDLAASTHPGATELPYNGVDEDCDPGTPDDDLDADGVSDALDCDAAHPPVYTGAEERCRGGDVECAGQADADAVDAPFWSLDADGDGHGGAEGTAACEAPEGYVATDTDCDDSNPAVSPARAEQPYNGVDDDCDPSTPDDDLDSDGFAADLD